MVNRKIENFTVVEAEALWGGQISISVNDPDRRRVLFVGPVGTIFIRPENATGLARYILSRTEKEDTNEQK